MRSLFFLLAFGPLACAPAPPPPEVFDDRSPALPANAAPLVAATTGPSVEAPPAAVVIRGAAITFASGLRLLTTTVWTGGALQSANDEGVSYSNAASGAGNGVVQLRRVDRTDGSTPENEGLCGAVALASYVAIVRHEGEPVVSVIAFSGEEKPSPMAHDSRVCATINLPAAEVSID